MDLKVSGSYAKDYLCNMREADLSATHSRELASFAATEVTDASVTHGCRPLKARDC